MSDLSRTGPEGETPVNPYSLLEAVNDSSDTAHTAWLIFLFIMTYLMIAVAGVTHRDLLLETPVELPILQVKIQLAQFFQFAPVILVLFHLGLISQLVLLARKALEFDHAIQLLETTEKRTHPLRLELHNFFFVQAIAGPHRSHVMSGFLHGMSWLTLVILPVLLILYIQVVFLPYHDIGITWMHRVALLADIAVLILIGAFLTRTEASFFEAFWRNTTAHPLSFAVTSVVLAMVALFSLFAATVPGEMLDRASHGLFQQPPSDAKGETRFTTGLAVPFFGAEADGSMFGVFRRNLAVTDTDLVAGEPNVAGEPSLVLRGRDLRFARLDRSDLHGADLTGANLDDASLVGTDLRAARLQCVDINLLLLNENRIAADCTSARRADFGGADLDRARLSGIDLRQAKFERAKLDGADLSHANLVASNFSNARLDKADVTGGVQALAANFLLASLQGADLTGAKLQLADLSSAALQGALLSHAELQGATLRDSELDGASLSQASLLGADMTGARIMGTDLRGARVWSTPPPQPDTTGLSDFDAVSLRPIDEAEAATLARTLARIENDDLRTNVVEGLSPITTAETIQLWNGSPDYQSWQTLAAAPQPVSSDDYKARLTDFLTTLMCKPRWSNGALATGVARRAQSIGFRGDMIAVHDRLKGSGCPASTAILPRAAEDLTVAVNKVRD